MDQVLVLDIWYILISSLHLTLVISIDFSSLAGWTPSVGDDRCISVSAHRWDIDRFSAERMWVTAGHPPAIGEMKGGQAMLTT